MESTDFLILKLETYYKGPAGEDCPTSKLIDSEEECMEAGSLIDHPFRGSISSSDRPNGCFWDRNGQSYLNDIFTESQFSLDIKDAGGICKHKGKFLDQIFIAFCNMHII